MKFIYRTFGVLLLISILAACGGPAPTTAPEVKATTAPPVVTRPIVIIASDDPGSADPAENWNFGGAAFLPQVYESLFKFVGETSPKIAPSLASEIPTVENGGISSDGLTYTIKLNADAKFHDGSPVNAEAVIYTFERLKSLKFGLEGLAANNIDKVEQVNATTVKFTLKQPFSDFVNALSSVWGSYIVNPKVAKANEVNGDFGHEWMKEHDAGSGPYILASYDTANKTITLERFADYWGGWTNPNPIEKAIIRRLAEQSGARPLLEKGDADVVINLPATDYAALEKATGFVSKKFPSIMQYYIALNGSVKPLDNVLVRQALQYSFNTDTVISDIFLGTLVKMDAAVGPGYPDVYPAKTQYGFDLEKAKSLLKEAGYENGFEITVNSIGAMPNDTTVLEFWQADLAKIGVTLKIQQVDWGTFDSTWFRCKATAESTIGQIAALGVGGDYPSAWEVLAQVYPTPRLSGDPCSVVYLDNATINDLFQKIGKATNPGERKTLFQSIYDAIADDAGAIWLGQGADLVTMRDVVQGYQYYFSRGGNYLPLAEMSLTK